MGALSSVEHILFPRGAAHNDAGLLAKFLTELRYESIPVDVLKHAKLITLDTIGCIVAGTDTPLGEKLLAAYQAGEDTGGCCVPGTRLQLSPSMATKLNAWLSDVLDYEDVAAGHPSATVIPAALAMAEYLKSTPKRFLAGVVAGYEAGLRVHDATQATPDVYRRFAVYHAWHGIAAGAAAMVVSGGSEEQFRSALGHAGANTSLPLWYVQYGRPAHALKANYGQMALGGIDAALCARRDIVGPFAMLSDPERGFAKIIGSDQFEPAQLSADLGEVWRTRESSLKPYPSCAFLHTTIDGVSSLVKEHNIDPENLEKLKIRSFSRITEWFSDKAPASDIDAQLSIEYVSAMALLSVEVGREWYSPSLMRNNRVAELMQRIDVELDPVAEEAFWKHDQYLSTIILHTRDGRSFTTTVEWPPGHWRRPFSMNDVAEKFARNLRGSAIEKNTSHIIKTIMNIDHLNSLDDLYCLLRAE
ncbi:MmgE/PrpD family protein [Rhizobium sp. CCGE531]|uniref:MmgE/PrpD family protein n=1 Tax=Rhizobium sp. CCGE531 TaxID=2364271 RepID=UPI0013C43464|nr:MmgE/PrpD family protein [Rhizobium sp. CCGE531]